MLNWRKKRHLRELNNERCRRYYQRHLSKKTPCQRVTHKEKIEPKKEQEKKQYFAGEPVSFL